jgi:hypothetical protein
MTYQDWYNRLAQIFVDTCDEPDCLMCPHMAEIAKNKWQDEEERRLIHHYAAEKLVWTHND